MLSWDRMRVFAAVAQHGSVSAAARSLHLTGPGVSQHIRRLEKEVGAVLVERDGRTIRLTPAGQALATHAITMKALAHTAEHDIARIDTDVAGALRIGSVASALRQIVVPALTELISTYPALNPAVVDGEGMDLLEALRRRTLDAVIFESWDSRPARLPRGVRTTTLITEPVHLAVPLGTRSGTQTLSSLADCAWAACPEGSDGHATLLQLFRDADTEPRIAYQVSDFATQLTLVEAGLCAALIPDTARDPHAAVTLLATDPAITRSLRYATSTDIPAVTALQSALRARLRHVAEDAAT